MQTRNLTVRKIEDLQPATSSDREFRPVQMGPGDVNGRLSVSEFGGITLTYGKFTSDIHVSGTLSNDKLSLAVVLKADDVRSFGKFARAGDMLVAGKAKENDGRYRSELEYAVINVDKADVLGIAEAEDLKICPNWLDGSDLYRLEGGKAFRLVRRTKSVLEKLWNGSLQAIGPVAEQSLADEIVQLFTSSLSSATTGNCMGEKPRPSLPKIVPLAEHWLAAHSYLVPRIQELSDDLDVSPRQLYRAFQAEVGMSPAKYLRRYRLTRARLNLLAADPTETTVTSVAFSLGLWELGRFSVEYRRLFGESPSQTLLTMR